MTNTGTSEYIVSAFLKGTCPTCINLFSRDFLDFFTESLSGAITQLQPSQREVVNYYARGMKKNIKTLQKVAQTARHRNIDNAAANATLAVVLFNGDMSNRVSGRMKLLLFQSTFWSVYRHFGSVVVMTKSAGDRDAISALGLPALEVSNLDLHTNTSRKLDYYTKVEIVHAELVKRSLQVTAQRWRSDATWASSGFAHLYFSQGDHLLHARRLGDIYRAMAAEPEGNFAAAPHAMQVSFLLLLMLLCFFSLTSPCYVFTDANACTEPSTPFAGFIMATIQCYRRKPFRERFDVHLPLSSSPQQSDTAIPPVAARRAHFYRNRGDSYWQLL